MRHTIIYLFFAAAIVFTSCTKSAVSYSNLIKDEKKQIEDYIKRNNIHIIYEEPEYMEWGEKDYLEVGDYCYFHLVTPGDTTTQEVAYKDRVNIRYRRYGLGTSSDTLSYWNTNELPEPIQFQYNVTSASACTAWHLAIQRMKYSGAVGTIITPSRLGFTNDNKSVTPYIYDLSMQIRRF